MGQADHPDGIEWPMLCHSDIASTGACSESTGLCHNSSATEIGRKMRARRRSESHAPTVGHATLTLKPRRKRVAGAQVAQGHGITSKRRA